ncbi:NADPH-dependent 7-cyano-7-deazaguanine reductase QueF [bacterium F11]|nr:NADPH-dependent 7-cyano-7-deazaguanine reductase QueF [bacterium F11]
MKTKLGYSSRHAKAGINAKMPRIECFDNQYSNDYQISISIPEYTSICPKTQLPDFGTLIITYCPDKKIMELKSLKMYVLKYRSLGIFYENAVNKILNDVVTACLPRWAIVRGEFSSRGGIKSSVEVNYNGLLGKRIKNRR